MTSIDRLRSLSVDEPLSADEVFDAIFSAGSVLTESEREAEQALEIAIRLLEARRLGLLPDGAEEAVEFLAEECGLYPYVAPEHFSHLTQTVIEAHAVGVRGGLYLHSKQMQVLLWLLAGDNVILSAPTSFGKSLLVDAYISRINPQVVVMLLPTIALIDETRRRLSETFGEKYSIITTVTEEYSQNTPTIFILTQERFLQRRDNLKIDLFFVDEFYKLDPDRDDGRFETLNLAVYKALPRARQCFMAGPHIRSIELGPAWTGNFRFVQTDYRTVTVNVVDRSKQGKRLKSFLEDLKSVADQNSLVFAATPGSAQKILDAIVDAGVSHASDMGIALRNWIASNYHPEWPIAKGVERGIAIHHGRLPRSLGQLFVYLFDQQVIRVLICTSTLIEGVNTSAANVFVYDKKIARSDFDFFSFANIRGRVGRMMRHFVGNAFLYHEAPEEVETRVDVPVLSDPGSSTDYIVINVDRDHLSETGQERQDRLPVDSGLSKELLQEHGVLGVELLIQLSRRIAEVHSSNPRLLIWSGYPDRDQQITLAELVLFVAHQRREQTGIHTPRQVGWAWGQLQALPSLPAFLHWFAGTFGRGDIPQGVDAAFQFLQACEFSFPRAAAAVESITKSLGPRSVPSYGPFLVAMENWFRPAWMKQMDETGLPLPLAERLASHVDRGADRKRAVEALRRVDWKHIAGLDEVDRLILGHALEA